MAVKLAFLHALSSLHVGSGQGVDVIDLPIARERATNLPVVPGTSIKGCLRDAYSDDATREAIFGPERASASAFAGALHVSDARLLLLPLRCLGATFVWATCPYVLRRFRRDAEAAGIGDLPAAEPALGEGEARLVTEDALLKLKGAGRLVLEEMDFEAQLSEAEAWCNWIAPLLFGDEAVWQAEFRKRFAIIDDKSFFFLADVGTEINAHIAIDEKTGTVDKSGALWYQESLPAETVLVLLLHTDRSRDPQCALDDVAVMRYVGDATKLPGNIQMGGKASTGQGLVRFIPV